PDEYRRACGRSWCLLRQGDPGLICSGKTAAVEPGLAERTDGFEHHACHRMRTRPPPPEQRRAERRSVAGLAHGNSLGGPQGGKTAGKRQVAGETAIYDDAF